MPSALPLGAPSITRGGVTPRVMAGKAIIIRFVTYPSKVFVICVFKSGNIIIPCCCKFTIEIERISVIVNKLDYKYL